MKAVRITVKKICVHQDLIDLYENPIENACNMVLGQEFISVDAEKPEGMCDEAWKVMEPYVQELARGKGNFFDGWMKDPFSAMVSCNDGFRPVSFYLETLR